MTPSDVSYKVPIRVIRKMDRSTRRCDNRPNCALLFGGICIQRLKAVPSLRHAKFAGLREDKAPTVIKEHGGEG